MSQRTDAPLMTTILLSKNRSSECVPVQVDNVIRCTDRVGRPTVLTDSRNNK